MAAIYTLGSQEGSRIRFNRFHDIAALKYGGWGIYFDEGTTHLVAENNLVYRTTHGGFHQHYGRENTVRNNIFAFGRDAKSSGQGSRITRAFSSTEISCSGIRGHSWPATGTSSMSASITTRTGMRRRVRSVSPIAPGTSGVKPAWTPTQRLPILISPTRPATISISQRNLRQRSRDFSHLTFRGWASVTIERFVHPAALPFILVEWKGSPRIDPARSERVPETLAPSAGDDG